MSNLCLTLANPRRKKIMGISGTIVTFVIFVIFDTGAGLKPPKFSENH